MGDTIAEYNELLQDYLTNSRNGRYFFVLEKSCGYKWMTAFYKDNTLAEVYRGITLDFQNPLAVLYIKNAEGEREDIPNTDTIHLGEFIRANNAVMRPVYPMPARVVYKIYYDDTQRAK